MRVLDKYPFLPERFADGREEQGGAHWTAACPLRCHRHARVDFALGEDGRLLFLCRAGCNRREILQAVGLKFADLFPARVIPDRVPRERTHYPYRDEAGELLYEVVRFEPGFRGREKDIRPRHKTPGGWEWGLPKEVRRVLYRLPELLAADPSRTVLVVAGEKDVEALRRLGVVATTNVFGEASRWLADYSRVLVGRDVVVIPDADPAGERHADEVVGSLVRHGAAGVRVAGLPAADATAFLNGLRASGVTDRDELWRELWQAIEAGGERWRPERLSVADEAGSGAYTAAGEW